jgi:hypothetical protein
VTVGVFSVDCSVGFGLGNRDFVFEALHTKTFEKIEDIVGPMEVVVDYTLC